MCRGKPIGYVRGEIPKYLSLCIEAKSNCTEAEILKETPIEKIHLGLWYTEENTLECRMCGYRPPKQGSWSCLFHEIRKFSSEFPDPVKLAIHTPSTDFP